MYLSTFTYLYTPLFAFFSPFFWTLLTAWTAPAYLGVFDESLNYIYAIFLCFFLFGFAVEKERAVESAPTFTHSFLFTRAASCLKE